MFNKRCFFFFNNSKKHKKMKYKSAMQNFPSEFRKFTLKFERATVSEIIYSGFIYF